MNQEAPSNNERKISGTHIASLIAVIVSISALMVSIYEARMMKEQQDLMVSQQKTSVWPYVKGNTLLNFDSISSVIAILENKGIGPALIDEITISINGEQLKDYNEIKEQLSKIYLDHPFFLSLASLKDHVLAPGETLEFLKIQYPSFKGHYQLVSEMEIEYNLCYCSVYGECWKVNTRGGIPNCE